MNEKSLPPGLVLWPDNGHAVQRVGVLISDIHCTDGSVGNQTGNETNWENFFHELETMLRSSTSSGCEILLILNGDVVDLLRSGKWAAAGVYPWQRGHDKFQETIVSIMDKIVKKHAARPDRENQSSGFFHFLRETARTLGRENRHVIFVPVLGNHDKELQVVPKAREIFYRECLGLEQGDFSPAYRKWVSRQLGSGANEEWPLLPFYFADPALRLFATHGQWRDQTNSRPTRLWKHRHGWQPHLWQREQYLAFSAPCFGDTIATSLLSHFIWNAGLAIGLPARSSTQEGVSNRSDKLERIRNVLREMDLYRPPAKAIVRLLQEVRQLDRRTENSRQLYLTVIDQFRQSLRSWLAHPETRHTAPFLLKCFLPLLSWLSRLHWTWLDTWLMHFLALLSEPRETVAFSRLPAFLDEYRHLGLRLHAEGHTHLTVEADLRYNPPQESSNYTYINLGAWRDRIVTKIGNKGYRRRSIGRALIVHGNTSRTASAGTYYFTLRDVTSWGDRLDTW